MARILIAGFQHETNTFGATKATLADFRLADSWPGLLLGDAVISGTEGTSLPLAGCVRAARAEPDVDLIPVVWASAEPAAHVTDEAFEYISGLILDAAATVGPLDGIYLDLHGAMVTESHDDGEGELLSRLREVTGPDLPIAVSLDLHANLTARMVEHASAITIFRTYPHLDMAETGARALRVLLDLVNGHRVHAAFRQVPFLIPLQAQHTGSAPFDGLYAQVAAQGPAPQCWAELAAGFPAADIPEAGPAILAYAESLEAADKIADRLLAQVTAAEDQFDCTLIPARDAVREAKTIATREHRPVIIADVQDNPGAGATSDTTGLLHALVDEGATGAILGMLADPEMAAKAHQAGLGATIEGPLGGKAGPNPAPFLGKFKVTALSDGRFPFQGEMYAGGTAEAGPTALLQVIDPKADVSVVVSSLRCQCLDLAIFTHLGLDPSGAQIVVVKSTVHFRADFEPMAAAILNAEAPGLFPCRLTEIPYRKLRRGIRLAPMGPTR